MRFEKIKLNEYLTLLAVVDDGERVVAAGVFNSEEDADTAEGFAQALLFNTGTAFPLGAMKDSDIPPTPPKQNELPRLDDVLKKLTEHAQAIRKQMERGDFDS